MTLPIDPTPRDPMVPLIVKADEEDLARLRHAKQPWLRRNAPLLAVAAIALIVGVLIGNAGGSEAPAAEPVPAKTIEVEVPGPADTNCQAVALELFSMLQDTTNEVVLPLHQVASEGFEAAFSRDAAAIEAVTAQIPAITTAQEDLTTRIETVGPDYQACVNP